MKKQLVKQVSTYMFCYHSDAMTLLSSLMVCIPC